MSYIKLQKKIILKGKVCKSLINKVLKHCYNFSLLLYSTVMFLLICQSSDLSA